MTTTIHDHDDRTARWNAYAAFNIQYHCPSSGRRFTGSGNTCPWCRTALHDRSHWLWYSPDEPRPEV